MSGINIKRVVLAGLLAGLVLNLCDIVIGVFTGEYWLAIMAQLEIPDLRAGQGIGILLINFLHGIALIWIYAAMRPRFGGTPRAPVIAALSIWSIAWLLTNASYVVLGLFPTPLMLIETAGAVIKLILAALAGAWIYREAAPAQPS